MLRLRTASLGAAVAILAVACSTKPADNAATADSVSATTGAAAAPTDTARAAPSPAAASADTTARSAAAAPAPATARATKVAPATTSGAADSTRKAKSTSTAKPATTTAKAAAAAKPAAATPSATAAPTSAAPTTAAPATAAPAAAEAQAGSVKVNRFMSYDAAAKRVNLEIIAAFNSQQGGFNFNGGSNGAHTITVPAGWQVQMHVKNVDAIPHSAIIIADQRPLPNAPDTPAIPRAYTSHVNDGLQPQTGADDLSFRASKPGNYLIYCGVPGHGPSGMFIKFVVSESATVPSYQM